MVLSNSARGTRLAFATVSLASSNRVLYLSRSARAFVSRLSRALPSVSVARLRWQKVLAEGAWQKLLAEEVGKRHWQKAGTQKIRLRESEGYWKEQ
jgi:hypothetical protein